MQFGAKVFLVIFYLNVIVIWQRVNAKITEWVEKRFFFSSVVKLRLCLVQKSSLWLQHKQGG